MSERATKPSEPGRDELALHAYHDGELRGFARWRFERRLARSPELRRELAGLAELGVLLREQAPAPAADLWERVALRLPAADARREAQAGEQEQARGFSWLRPLGAAAAALAVAAFAAQQWLAAPALERAGVVRWMDSRGRSVMVLEEDAQREVTIIWLLDGTPSAGAAGGEPHAS